MTRCALLALPLAVPVAKAVAAPKSIYDWNLLNSVPLADFPQAGQWYIVTYSACPKNSIEIIRPEAWAGFIEPRRANQVSEQARR